MASIVRQDLAIGSGYVQREVKVIVFREERCAETHRVCQAMA